MRKDPKEVMRECQRANTVHLSGFASVADGVGLDVSFGFLRSPGSLLQPRKQTSTKIPTAVLRMPLIIDPPF